MLATEVMEDEKGHFGQLVLIEYGFFFFGKKYDDCFHY